MSSVVFVYLLSSHLIIYILIIFPLVFMGGMVEIKNTINNKENGYTQHKSK